MVKARYYMLSRPPFFSLFSELYLNYKRNAIDKLNIVYPYYNSADMFAEQQRRWLRFPDDVLRKIRFIIVDDGSQVAPAVNSIIDKSRRLRMDVLRIDVDIYWNTEGALNLGALFCINEWMFMSDIDHYIPQELIRHILSMKASRRTYFTFNRVASKPNWQNISELVPIYPHKGSFLIHWDLYWKVGGRNEDFCGKYSMGWAFRNKLRKYGIWKSIPLPIVEQGDETIDSSTRLERTARESRREERKRLKSREFKRSLPVNPLRFPWHMVYSSRQAESRLAELNEAIVQGV